MSLDNDIKRALERRADDVQPAGAAYDRIEARVARAHKRRLALGSAGMVMAIAAAVLAVPRILPDRPNGFAGPGDPTVDTTATATPLPIAQFRNERDVYQASMPRQWTVSTYEGNVELHERGLSMLAAGEDTFVVEIQHRYGERFDDGEGGLDFRPSDDIAGRNAVAAERTRGGAREVVYRVDWTAPECPPNAECDADPATLRIMLFGSTGDLWDAHGANGQIVVDTLRTLPNAPEPSGHTLTLYGSVDAVVGYDAATARLVQFLDARVEGDRAEGYLTAEARASYASRPENAGLYTGGTPSAGYFGYSVERRDDTGDGAAFSVRLFVTEDQIVSESITVEKLEAGYRVTAAAALTS